jgi:hypothetical protein
VVAIPVLGAVAVPGAVGSSPLSGHVNEQALQNCIENTHDEAACREIWTVKSARCRRGSAPGFDARRPLTVPLTPAPSGGLIILDNFRRREWAPAIEASGVCRPARIYDLRSTFASNALAAGVSVFELARVMGTSIAMIERSYGTLIEGAGADIARRLGEFEAGQERAGETFGPLPGHRPDTR